MGGTCPAAKTGECQMLDIVLIAVAVGCFLLSGYGSLCDRL
jgi:hypothetical protein